MKATSVEAADQAGEQAYLAALGFLYDRINYERMAAGTSRYPFRLKRMRDLLARLGLQRYLHRSDRRAEIPLVHIAGTKGKGSAASLTSAALTESGLTTGLYTSPHLNRLEERFRVDGKCCEQQTVINLVERLRGVVDRLNADGGGSPSFFELTTALALMHFDACQCQAIVLEVGLGGRLDSTNVCAPSVTAITSIGLDHQHVLGDTVEQIAAEKAGIIKSGVPIVSGVIQPGPAEVIRKTADRRQAPLYELGQAFTYRSDPDPDWGSHVHYFAPGQRDPDGRSFRLLLDGQHQAHNAAVAMTCLDLLAQQGVAIPSAAVAAGFEKFRSPGRIERFRLPNDVIAIVDAAHNDDSIEALCRCLRHRCANRQITVVFGTSRDKSAAPMLSALGQIASRLVLTQFRGNPRYYPTEALLPLVPVSLQDGLAVVEDPVEACRTALAKTPPGSALVLCGSFFLVAETRDWFAELAVE